MSEHSNPVACEQNMCGICEPGGAELPSTIGVIPGSWRDVYGVEQMEPLAQYIDSMYWSLTVSHSTVHYRATRPAT